MRIPAVLAAAFVLWGCSTAGTILGTATEAVSFFQREDVNLKEKNYAAADYLTQQTREFIKDGQLVRAEPLIDNQAPQIGTALARVIPEQVGVRLSQLGYTMDLRPVAGETEEANYLKPGSAAAVRQASFILSGTYVRQRRDVAVNLRVTRVNDGRVVAAFDYMMPVDREISRMLESEPRIFKVEE